MTPMMAQYRTMKENYADAILFFRLGDFYEMFFEDAIEASRLLQITLTSRKKGEHKAPMCRIPYHAANSYISKLKKNKNPLSYTFFSKKNWKKSAKNQIYTSTNYC